jgi:HEAT repeat protein
VNGSGIQEKVIETVVVMITAIINLRLYPPTNAMIMKSIERLYDSLQGILVEEESLSLAESDRNLLISGDSLSQKNMQKPQVAIFLMLMLNWGIKSIGFNKGLERDELSFLLELLGKKPDDVIKEKSLEQIIAEEHMPHIQLNQKIYVQLDQDRQAVSSMAITDDDIISYITSENPDIKLDLAKLQEMAKDHEWVSRIFQSGIRHLSERDDARSNIKLSESLIQMLRSLGKIADHEEKEKLSLLAAKSISDMDADFIATLLTRNMDGLLENSLFDQVIDRIDHEKFETVANQLHQVLNGIQEADGDFKAATQEAYQHLMSTGKGIDLQHQIEGRQAREKEARENKILKIKNDINLFMLTLDEGNPEANIAESLPEKINILYSLGEKEAAEASIEYLVVNLQSDRYNIRLDASRFLADIFEILPSKVTTDLLIHHTHGILPWIKTETVSNNSFHRICNLFKDLAQIQIRNQQFVDSLSILETIHHAASPQPHKDKQLQSIAAALLKEISSSDILEILIQEFRTDNNNQRNASGRHLVMLAEHSINRLLDLLLESQITSERVLILNLISEMGQVAAPSVAARIDENSPWYFLRNLARLLGRIGTENHAKNSLAPLLVHSDIRVQKETFKSINSIGGRERADIFLNALSGCDDQMKSTLVTAVGALKHRDAVKPLIELFKSKVNLSEDMKIEFQGKICLALGNIGDREALPFLTEISKQNGIFGFRGTNQKIKAAASRAVDMLPKS